MSRTRHTKGTVLDTELYTGIFLDYVMVLDTVLGYVIVLDKTQVLGYGLFAWGNKTSKRNIYIYIGKRAYETSMEIFLPLFAA